jgi:hypothetical protein
MAEEATGEQGKQNRYLIQGFRKGMHFLDDEVERDFRIDTAKSHSGRAMQIFLLAISLYSGIFLTTFLSQLSSEYTINKHRILRDTTPIDARCAIAGTALQLAFFLSLVVPHTRQFYYWRNGNCWQYCICAVWCFEVFSTFMQVTLSNQGAAFYCTGLTPEVFPTVSDAVGFTQTSYYFIASYCHLRITVLGALSGVRVPFACFMCFV